jgi:hypothetical protein
MVLRAMRSIVSRRAASGAPQHEGLRFRQEIRPHPEEPAKGGRLEGWVAKELPTKFYFICDCRAVWGQGQTTEPVELLRLTSRHR